MAGLGPLAALTTSAVPETVDSLSASDVTVEPSTRSSGVSSMASPGRPVTLSTSRTSPTDTFSWRPPARTIAYTVKLTLSSRVGIAAFGTGPSTRARWAHQGHRLPAGRAQLQTEVRPRRWCPTGAVPPERRPGRDDADRGRRAAPRGPPRPGRGRWTRH